MNFASLKKGLGEELGPWLRTKDKKPILTQIKESVRLARRYRAFPTQYLRAQLYLNEKGDDIEDFVPFGMISKEQSVRTNKAESTILNDKILFAQHLAGLGIPTPSVLFYQMNGRLFRQDGTETDEKACGILLDEHGKCFCKPIFGHFGQGTFAVRAGSMEDQHAVFSRTDDYLVQPFLNQHPDVAKYHRASVNCVRIASWQEGGKVEFLATAFKMGSGGYHEDHVMNGGLAVRVDPATGALFKAARFSPKFKVGPIHEHPDSGIRFEGQVLPLWKETLDVVTAAARAFPNTAAIGWDVAVTQDGPVVIEGNCHWGTSLFQLVGIPFAKTAIGRAAMARRGLHAA